MTPWQPQLLFFTPQQEYGTPAEKIWNVVPGWGTGAKKAEEIEQAKKLVVAAGFPNGIDNMDQMARAPIGTGSAPEEVQQELAKIRDRLKVTKAVHATGPCGNTRIVVLDSDRVAVAGKVVKPEDVQDLKWSETTDREGRRVETVRDKQDSVVMTRFIGY
jgi:hypothetical protein